jgi:hypothetical protein
MELSKIAELSVVVVDKIQIYVLRGDESDDTKAEDLELREIFDYDVYWKENPVKITDL